MARDPVPADSSLSSALRTFRRPWPIMGAGLACTVIGLALSQTPLLPLRLLFLGAGLLLAGIAVARRLQTASWDLLEDRAESAGLLAVSAFVALLAYYNMEPSWDSGHVFLGALIIVSLAGSFLVLLPRSGRRIAAVVLVLLHFGGILTAVMSVPPNGQPSSWIAMQLWGNVYRYYLTFAYLTNAYHFYSPDPGPATLLWFHVEYADGSSRWIKIPNRHESPVGLYHLRMLAAAESANQNIGGIPLWSSQIALWEQKFKRKYELLPGIPHDSWEEIQTRRSMGEALPFVDPNDNNRSAPLKVIFDHPVPYSEPNESSRRLIASYARHIAHTSPDPADPHNAVQAVRVYRVIHNMISPGELNEGQEPLMDWNFLPYYMGKYDADGRLLDPKDPFLFWFVPFAARAPKRYPEPGTQLWAHQPPNEPWKIINFVEIHATQSDKFQPAKSEK